MKLNKKSLGKFYAVLSLTLALVAVIAFVQTQQKIKRDITDMTNQITVSIPEIPSEKVDEKITDIPDTREETTDPLNNLLPVDATTAVGIKRAEKFVLPLSGNILKEYSNGNLVQSKTMGDWRAHTGTDYAGNEGDSVVTVNNGVIKKIYTDSLWGTVVEIDHGDGMTARYCGLKENPELYESEAVSVGQKLGELGKLPIEAADGTHLHIEILIDGKTVNPTDYLK